MGEKKAEENLPLKTEYAFGSGVVVIETKRSEEGDKRRVLGGKDHPYVSRTTNPAGQHMDTFYETYEEAIQGHLSMVMHNHGLEGHFERNKFIEDCLKKLGECSG